MTVTGYPPRWCLEGSRGELLLANVQEMVGGDVAVVALSDPVASRFAPRRAATIQIFTRSFLVARHYLEGKSAISSEAEDNPPLAKAGGVVPPAEERQRTRS